MFRLSIVTPEKVFFDGQIKSLMAPGTEGYLGILSHHAPLISALVPGKIEYRDADDQLQVLAVSGGFLEVSNNVATILADAVERPSEIDVERARASMEKALKQLDPARPSGESIDIPSVRQAIERAANRIRIFESTR